MSPLHPSCTSILPVILRQGILSVLMLGMVGCEMFQPTYSETNRTDRLLKAYPDINSGRFALIADFEEPSQLGLFHLSSTDAPLEASSRSSGPATGFRCLSVDFNDSDTQLVIDNTDAEEWYLKRDWRDFDLLLMQVHSPYGNVQLDICVTGGQEESESTICTNRALSEGWNLIRLDVSEIAEQIPIDEVLRITFSTPARTEPVKLQFDDIILAGNTRDLFGHSDGVNGDLFLRRKGLRWFVGAAGRFEIGFSGGQIVQWHDLQNDPNRLYNLVQGAVMGPSPFVVPVQGNLFSDASDANNDDFPSLGKTVIARQKIRELSPARIVVEGEWRNVRPGESIEDAPFRRWIWSIYPTGDIYVDMTCTTQREGWRPEEIGFAVARADREDVEEYVHRPAQLEDPEPIRHLAFGWMRAEELAAPALLLLLHDSTQTPELYFLRDSESAQAAIIAAGGQPQRPEETWSCMLNVWPSDNWRGASPVGRAMDYSSHDNRVRVETGDLVTDDERDRDHDGFRESDGCYLLRPSGQQMRCTVDGTSVPLHNPVFLIDRPEWDKAWVYVDYALQEDPHRDEFGNLIFQIPGVIDNSRVIEVYYRSSGEDEDGTSRE